MVYTATLSVAVEPRQSSGTGKCWIPVFAVTQEDHVWRTLVGDREQDGILKLAPLIPYLQIQAEEFAREHPEPLQFGSVKKAVRFSESVIRRPLNLRGYTSPVRYPGSGPARRVEPK